MRVDLLDYELPKERIAAWPTPDRDGSRLMVLGAAGIEHRRVAELDTLLAPGALLVVNDTRVVRARLLGAKHGSGGRVEIFLTRRLTADDVGDGAAQEPERWLALGRSSKPLREGARVRVDGGRLDVEVVRVDGDGTLEVTLRSEAGVDVDAAIEEVGHVPLPPYVMRARASASTSAPVADEATDRERYQTVFARVPGAVAAPTAGLHISRAVLERLEARGVEVASVTLHVGLGTFQPVTAVDLDHHRMHAEVFSVPAATAAAVARARGRGGEVVAVGTTVVRALESAADAGHRGHVVPTAGETRLLVQPGYSFRVVDRLLTNFHLPRSTLLALVAAFAGRERILDAYRVAIEEGYRFFSYGDAMLIEPCGGGGTA